MCLDAALIPGAAWPSLDHREMPRQGDSDKPSAVTVLRGLAKANNHPPLDFLFGQ